MNYLLEKSKNLPSLWGRLLAEELVRLGVKLVCIAPGSRSTPLVVACAEHDGLKKMVCHDERSAGFCALGYSKATGTPAAVIVTSGSAVANLFPAVVEAANDRVPILVITADRPPELRDVGANQTIDQTKIFGSFVRWQVDLPVPDVHVSPRFILSSIDYGYQRTLTPLKGPVHLNFMFREPFVPDYNEGIGEVKIADIQHWLSSQLPLRQLILPKRVTSEESLLQVSSLMKNVPSGAIIVARSHDTFTEDRIIELSRVTGWPILPEVLSALRFREGDTLCNYVDQCLIAPAINENGFEMVIQFGGHIVSKRLQQLIERNPPRYYVMVDDHFTRMDPASLCTHQIETTAYDFVTALCAEMERSKRNSSGEFMRRSQIVHKVLNNYDETKLFNEITVARTLAHSVSKEQFLFVSSSMPIRDLNMFAMPRADRLQVFANRGASGIDGIISSACGVAIGLDKCGVLFCGDLSFLHDLNGLSLLKSVSKPLQIVVVNNNGGGIFAMLDIYRQQKIFTPYFDAEHDIDLGKIANSFGITYHRVEARGPWEKMLGEIRQPQEHAIIEVISDKHDNRIQHDELRELVYNALTASDY